MTEPATPNETVSDDSPKELKEIKYDLNEMLAEVSEERHASSMAKQLIDQEEIQKMISDRKKKQK